MHTVYAQVHARSRYACVPAARRISWDGQGRSGISPGAAPSAAEVDMPGLPRDKPRMERFFNTEGPCEPSRHYMLPPTARLPTIRQLIDRGKYLVLHAPRQVGKTTALRALAQELTASGRYASVVLSMEMGAPF